MDRRRFVQFVGFGAGAALGSSPLPAVRSVFTGGAAYRCSVGTAHVVFRPSGAAIDLEERSIEGAAGAVVSDDDSLFVVDRERSRVLVYGQRGGLRREFGRVGSGPGELERPTDLAVDGDRVFVCDPLNHRVQVFDRDGNFLDSIGKRTGGDRAKPSMMNAPRAITVDSHGRLHVLDGDAHIHVLSASGERLDRYAGFGAERGRMTCPRSVVSRGSKILVADPAAGAVHAFDESGRFERRIEVYDGGRRVAPIWITAKPDGSSYVRAGGSVFGG